MSACIALPDSGSAASPTKVLDLDKWEFYVLPTADIDEELQSQKTVVLSRIKSLTDAVPYSRLRERIDEALARV